MACWLSVAWPSHCSLLFLPPSLVRFHPSSWWPGPCAFLLLLGESLLTHEHDLLSFLIHTLAPWVLFLQTSALYAFILSPIDTVPFFLFASPFLPSLSLTDFPLLHVTLGRSSHRPIHPEGCPPGRPSHNLAPTLCLFYIGHLSFCFCTQLHLRQLDTVHCCCHF